MFPREEPANFSRLRFTSHDLPWRRMLRISMELRKMHKNRGFHLKILICRYSIQSK
jgi:hypothetical protein